MNNYFIPFIHERLTEQDLINRIQEYQDWYARIHRDNQGMRTFCEARLNLLYDALRDNHGMIVDRLTELRATPS